MNSQPADRASLTGPYDRSLDAYKTWILEIARRLTTEHSTLKLTEEEWVMYWKEFWKEKFKR
jgi:hypothetical protein